MTDSSDLICRDAGRGFKASDLVNAHAFISHAGIQIFEYVSSDIFGGRI